MKKQQQMIKWKDDTYGATEAAVPGFLGAPVEDGDGALAGHAEHLAPARLKLAHLVLE